MKNKKERSPWAWVPTLYFAEGIPYVAVVTISVIMYKNLGMSNTDIALYTSWLYLPWVIKPFWSPFVDLLKTKRWWITTMQLFIGAGLAGIAFCIPTESYVQWTLAFFWLLAFSSATHDIAADGFYMLGLSQDKQAFFVGIRSTFYRIATIVGQGVLVYFAGYLEKSTGNIPYAWSMTFYVIAGMFILFYAYHTFVLPRPASDKGNEHVTASTIMTEFLVTFKTFFTKKHAAIGIFFMLTYRFAEAQLLKLIQPFLLDPREIGGLGLSTSEVGITYGTYGVIGLTIGGLVGGFVAAKGGLKKWLWPMMLSMILTCLTFVYMSFAMPESLLVIHICIIIEQFGYGFGFTAYMLFLMYYSEGEHKTAHYAICTGFMALGMMLPGMFAGYIQEQVGYQNFFLWVMGCAIVPIVAAALLKIDPEYGKSKKQVTEE